MDNFEWAFGYKIRVGLVYTDFQTLERTPKDSAFYYKKVMETNGACLHDDLDLSPAGIDYD
jgi:beta-glucosidase